MQSSEFLPEASIFDERTLKNTAWQSPSEIISWLAANGFKKIGNGVFSAAYAKPSHNRIVKVSNRQDDCWIKFAQWAMTKTSNKHLPKIPWVKRYQGKRKGVASEFFITIIERLLPITKKSIISITDPAILSGIHSYVDMDYETHERIEDKLGDNIDHIAISNQDHLFVKTLRRLVYMAYHSPGCQNDLHMGNLMLRPDGTVVVTDPLAGNVWAD